MKLEYLPSEFTGPARLFAQVQWNDGLGLAGEHNSPHEHCCALRSSGTKSSSN